METNNYFKQRVEAFQTRKGMTKQFVVEVLPGVCASRDPQKSGSKMDLYFDSAQFEQVHGHQITTYFLETQPNVNLPGTMASIMLNGLEGDFIGFVDGTGIAPGLTGLVQAKQHARAILVQK